MTSRAPRASQPARRKYDNRRRRADAEARQRRVIEEATGLFVEHGFAATSIDDIAAAADVSAPTIYATFGSKSGVLAQAIDVSVVGDYNDVPVVDRVLTLIDQAGIQVLRQFAAVAGFIRTVNERVAPLARVMEQAASTDPALEKLRTTLIAAIRADCAVAIERNWRSALRPGLSEDAAADAMATMMSPSVYSTLVVDMGWSPDRYQEWLAHALPHLLLRPELSCE
jgi:AcrR family transcriptional regulator